MFDYPPSGVVAFVRAPVCLYVCLSDDNFRKPWRRNYIFVHQRNMGQFFRSLGQSQGNGNKMGSKTHAARKKFACGMADRIVW